MSTQHYPLILSIILWALCILCGYYLYFVLRFYCCSEKSWKTLERRKNMNKQTWIVCDLFLASTTLIGHLHKREFSSIPSRYIKRKEVYDYQYIINITKIIVWWNRHDLNVQPRTPKVRRLPLTYYSISLWFLFYVLPHITHLFLFSITQNTPRGGIETSVPADRETRTLTTQCQGILSPSRLPISPYPLIFVWVFYFGFEILTKLES